MSIIGLLKAVWWIKLLLGVNICESLVAVLRSKSEFLSMFSLRTTLFYSLHSLYSLLIEHIYSFIRSKLSLYHIHDRNSQNVFLYISKQHGITIPQFDPLSQRWDYRGAPLAYKQSLHHLSLRFSR